MRAGHNFATKKRDGVKLIRYRELWSSLGSRYSGVLRDGQERIRKLRSSLFPIELSA